MFMTIAPPINFPLETAAKGTGIKVLFSFKVKLVWVSPVAGICSD